MGHFGSLTSSLDASSIRGCNIHIETAYSLNNIEFGITVNHLGIKDYSLLFFSIENESLRKRLGNFYEEMETSFDNGIWLSFILMAGAVMEGLLLERIKEDLTFNKLINKAFQLELLSDSEKDLLHVVRKYRNLVHAANHNQLFIDRKHAMNSRVLVDKLIESVSTFP